MENCNLTRFNNIGNSILTSAKCRSKTTNVFIYYHILVM